MLTDKQIRNGIPGPTAGQNSAVPSVDLTATISSAKGAAEATTAYDLPAFVDGTGA